MTDRIAAIGERANALRRNGHWTVEDVRRLAEEVRKEGADLSAIEARLFDAEERHAYRVRILEPR